MEETSAALHREVRNGPEIAERPNDGRMTVRGAVERLANEEDLGFVLPGQYPSSRRCQIRSGPREGNRRLDFSRLSLDPPAKEVKLAAVRCS